jgi:membrane protein DedA with SNARE-associated domain
MDWEAIQAYIRTYGYLAVAAGTFVDQSGLQSFVVAGGVLSRVAAGVSIHGVIGAGALGSFLSDVLLYGIGRWRADWLDRIVRSEKGRARLRVMGDGMRRWAFPLITLGRILPWIGRFVPAAAGLRKVGFLRVAAYSALGSLTLATLYGMLGYFAAESVERMGQHSAWLWLGALLVSVPVAGWFLKRFDRAVQRRLEAEHQAEIDATANPD